MTLCGPDLSHVDCMLAGSPTEVHVSAINLFH